MVDLASAWPTLYGLSCLPPTGIGAGPLAPWIIWSLWTARNKLAFENKESTPEDVISNAIGTAREWLNEQLRDSSAKKAVDPKTSPNPPNTVMIKTDAA